MLNYEFPPVGVVPDISWFRNTFHRREGEKVGENVKTVGKTVGEKGVEKGVEKVGENVKTVGENVGEKGVEKVGENVSENEKTVGKTVGKISDLIREKPYITRKELSNATGLSVVFYRTPQKTPLTKLEQQIYDQVNKDNRISRARIAENLKISPDTVKEYIEKLKNKGWIKRHGPAKGGHWEVL